MFVIHCTLPSFGSQRSHYRPETTEMGGQRDHKGQSQGIVGNNLEPADDKSDWGHGVTRIRFQGNSTPRVRIGKGNNEEAQLCWRGARPGHKYVDVVYTLQP